MAGADELSELEARVKESAANYNAAVARQEELAAEIEELDGKIAKLEKELPKQQERSDESCRALYKYSSDTTSVVSMLLSAESFTDALAMIDSYNWIIEYNVAELVKTRDMKEELEGSRAKVQDDKDEADAQAAAAAESLASAKAAREEARQRALEAQRAEEEARQQEIANSDASDSEKKTQAKQAEEESSSTSADNVGWEDDKTAFVNKWAPRIDAYLSGSPTAGTGKTYAAAAWDNGVDPRWAPAISCVESSKGAACFASYNAWGYGGSGFSSWADGINTVVSALGSSLYGGYLTKAAAQTYCPPTWQNWYSECAAEMSSI